MPRHDIVKMTLREISSVDKGAQRGAVATITKRDAVPPQNPPEPTIMKTRAELEAAIAKFRTDGGTDATIADIKKAAGDLKAEDLLPKDGALAKAAADPRVGELEAEVAKMGKLTSLTPAQRAMYDKMSPGDQAKYLLKSSADLAKALDEDIQKASGDDPVVYTCDDGTHIRKSDGDLALRFAKRSDEDRREAHISKAAAQDESITKRANDDIGKLGGDLDERKALVKAVDGIADAGTRGKVHAMLKGASAAFDRLGKNLGTTGGNDPNAGVDTDLSKADATSKLDELAKARAAELKIPFAKAYSDVLDTPKGNALYKQTIK